jgi:DNA-binding MarR family transcriptional regulator
MSDVDRPDTDNLGFLLAKASQRWNELLAERFLEQGFGEVRPSYGSVLLPLFEEDGLRMGQIAGRARLSKQTMTTLVRLCERDGLVARERDPRDARAVRIKLSDRAKEFRPVAGQILRGLDDRVLAALGERQTATLASALKGVMDL